MDCTCPRGSKQATLACTRRRQCAWSRSELSAWSGSAPEFQAKNGPNSCLIAWFPEHEDQGRHSSLQKPELQKERQRTHGRVAYQGQRHAATRERPETRCGSSRSVLAQRATALAHTHTPAPPPINPLSSSKNPHFKS